MAKHSMKSSRSRQQGDINTRAITQKPSGARNYASNSPSLPKIGVGIGSGDLNSRYSKTSPSGDSGVIGLAQAKKTAGALNNQNSTSQLGNRVHKSAKPVRR